MNPIIFTINNHYQFRYFGILLATGVVILFLMTSSNLRRAKIRFSRDELLDWIIIVFLYGLIGARLLYVAMNMDYYFGPHAKWYEFLAIWRGGFAVNGGIIFSLFALWILNRQRKSSLDQITDQVIAPLFIALVFVRIGNFINGEVFGSAAEEWIGFVFKYGPASKQYAEIAIHPVMLYEAALYLLGFFMINTIRLSRFRNGFTTACGLLWYSMVQGATGLIREDGSTIFTLDESFVFGVIGSFIAFVMIFGNRLYRKLPSPDQQFPSTRRWSI